MYSSETYVKFQRLQLDLECVFQFVNRNGKDLTPLDVAAYHGHDKIVHEVIKAVSKKNSESFLESMINPVREHDSPLHIAITQGQLDVVKILLCKSKVTLRNCKSWKTPIQEAVERGQE